MEHSMEHSREHPKLEQPKKKPHPAKAARARNPGLREIIGSVRKNEKFGAYDRVVAVCMMLVCVLCIGMLGVLEKNLPRPTEAKRQSFGQETEAGKTGRDKAAEAPKEKALDTGGTEKMAVLQLVVREPEYLTLEEDKAALSHCLRLHIPSNADPEEIRLFQSEDGRSVQLEMPQMGQVYFYNYSMVGHCSQITGMSYAGVGRTGVLEIQNNGVYVPRVSIEKSFLYLDFVKPKDYYDQIVLVDPGKGGEDSGTTVELLGKTYQEKEINYAIAKRIQALGEKALGGSKNGRISNWMEDAEEAGKKKTGFYLSRLGDDTKTEKQRLAYAKKLGAAIILSVHCNSTSTGRISGINGASVLYKQNDKTGRAEIFARNCLDALVEKLDCADKGLVMGAADSLVSASKLPLVKVKVGFMTNEMELKKLVTKEYQNKAAEALYDAVLKTLDSLEKMGK